MLIGAHIILPKPTPLPRARVSPVSPDNSDLRACLALPPDTRRIVILSNIRAGFPLADIGLRPGDFIIHLNHAVHAADAMSIPGTHHALLIRHNTKTGRHLHWFHNSSLDGYEQILCIEDRNLLLRCSWWLPFRAITQKSPTTGFIAANLCRELFPHTPLILAGFDPAHPHGTNRWSGHDWLAEAAWYRKHHFACLPPAYTPCLHQIWIGSSPPPREAAWIRKLSAAASAAGWRHILWDWPALRRTFGDDPATALLDAAIHAAPTAQTFTLASDFFRLRLLAHLPGLYLDTDFNLTSNSFPPLPAGHDVGLMSESYNTRQPASALFLSRTAAPFALASQIAAARLASSLGPASHPSFPQRLASLTAGKNILHAFGPPFIRSSILPAFRRASFPFSILPPSIVGHSRWHSPSPLSHHGTGHWLHTPSTP